jgi:outer membrane protein OmpA-like peptidoglycan-associated protein
LYFAADSSNLHDNTSFSVLDELYQYLEEHPKVTIEVRGHTSAGSGSQRINMKYSEELSKSRAKTVALYLVRKGIAADRIQYRGYGPREPVASNDNPEGRKKNQRVEIKILST